MTGEGTFSGPEIQNLENNPMHRCRPLAGITLFRFLRNQFDTSGKTVA
jgi:hypothetical protein